QHTIAHGWLIPCLLFCFMLGPLGMLLYVVVREVNNSQKSRKS
ncbi:MAG: DUF4281 domain-containing protein, partial [Cytophagaceae bacterium]